LSEWRWAPNEHRKPRIENRHAGFVDTGLSAQTTRRWRGGRREKPFRFLLDSRLFRRLCDPEQTAALDGFLASLAHLRLMPEGGLPDLEMTPLAILDVLGVEPPQFPAIALPKSLARLDSTEVGILLLEQIKKQFGKAPELEPSSLERRVDELRQAAAPAAHELFDLCLTRFVSREKFEQDILAQLAFDALFTFRFSAEYRERMTFLFHSFLLNNETQVSGLTRVRLLRGLWDRSLERILKKNPTARGEILAVDQEMKPRTFKDFLAWEVIHYAVLGYPRKQVHPVIAFTPEPEERLRARCRAHKTAVRAFLDEVSPEELRNEFRPLLRAWTPGWLVPCRMDGTFEAALSTEEVPVWAGLSLWDSLPPAGRAGEG
jgi:hypothetical protein